MDAEAGSIDSAGAALTVGSLWNAIAGRQLGDEEWAVVCERVATTLDELATGRAWRICQALLTLHAIADEACAGTGVAVADVPRDGHRFRARARELLARTGTLSRISRQRLRVLPRVRNPAGGPSIRSLSRYVCVQGPGVDAVWNRIPARTLGPGEFAPGELVDLADRVLLTLEGPGTRP